MLCPGCGSEMRAKPREKRVGSVLRRRICAGCGLRCWSLEFAIGHTTPDVAEIARLMRQEVTSLRESLDTAADAQVRHMCRKVAYVPGTIEGVKAKRRESA